MAEAGHCLLSGGWIWESLEKGISVGEYRFARRLAECHPGVKYLGKSHRKKQIRDQILRKSLWSRLLLTRNPAFDRNFLLGTPWEDNVGRPAFKAKMIQYGTPSFHQTRGLSDFGELGVLHCVHWPRSNLQKAVEPEQTLITWRTLTILSGSLIA